ncbi:ornithine carbamoyltransferase [Hirschia baltica]|uniref:Ornithine carbamoyltransferase, catabolic n=1 Tax=Hirschia baltica (strain ATCC 49814 / DSM 5838 / IFAM 1418) TaxID=582402 RepID=C6XMA3_HIRBI|nr:ornithine carbamoyltransferase [Hirschia baltica]ACT58046.1 ornithine carbamoyltransferase [Hirschia baltica ATCC 49814]
MSVRHFLDIFPLPASELRAILDNAKSRKNARAGMPKGSVDPDAVLAGYTLAMIFEKSSTRTRLSFDMGIRQLGGTSIVLNAADMQLGRGETIEDTSRVLSRMIDAVMIRANSHADVEAFAAVSDVPVINGLTNTSHPCQIMADLQTLEEHGLDLKGARIAWVGDGNNVAASFAHAAPKFGFSLALGTPQGYELPEIDIERGRQEQGRIDIYNDPAEAVAGADVVVADTFVSMGDTDADKRLKDLMPFQVTQDLMDKANGGAKFLHCLPAHRGEEVAAEVIDGSASLIFDEAENRLHAQKAVLEWCLKS